MTPDTRGVLPILSLHNMLPESSEKEFPFNLRCDAQALEEVPSSLEKVIPWKMARLFDPAS
jgi:hypothetical protein